MPQPTGKRVRSFTTDHDYLLEKQPACLAAIGQTALAWTQTEEALSSLLAAVLGRTSRNSGGGHGISPNWIARAAMDQAETIRVRLKIADAILLKLLDGNALADEWRDLGKTLFKRARERNIVIHTSWGWSEEAPEGLVETDQHSPAALWKVDDFRSVIGRIEQANHALFELQRKILDAIHDGKITNYVTPDMIVA